MANDKHLHIYLNDHLAGATGGVELARRTASNNEGTEFGDLLKRLADEIEEDRQTLLGIIEAVGGTADKLKQGAAWTAEKVGRLKLNGKITGYSELSRLVEIEGLAVGVEAKVSLWRSLRQLSRTDPRLDETLLDRLIERGTRQRDELEAKRLAAAAIAIG
jgi:hypothetical protein